MHIYNILKYLTTFLIGTTIGGFLNLWIDALLYKIKPEQFQGFLCRESEAVLHWKERIPLIPYFVHGGKYNTYNTKKSIRYPLVELSNGIFYILIIFARTSISNDLRAYVTTVLYCIVESILLVLSVVDFKTYEIPVSLNRTVLLIALVTLGLDYKNWNLYIIGFFIISVFLYLLFFISKGKAIGGGDVKLMAVCGLMIGFKNITLAFFLGCILASIIHSIRMRVGEKNRVLALGPYLSMGIVISMLYGEKMIRWYLSLF